jgi:Ca-activated chloride channel family protein
MGDQKLGADDITFDKGQNRDGQETEAEGEPQLSDAEMQALWLRRVQTKPADFLKAKFAYQLATDAAAGDAP